MREITCVEAIREAIREEMIRDKRVFLIGEDIGSGYEGAFKVTKGLAQEFGDERVRETPISEATIVGAALGAAVTGMRPVAEIMFMNIMALAMDQACNQAAFMRYMFGGQAKVPLVIRTVTGGGTSMAAHHSSSLEAWFMHTPGLMVAVPSTPYDAKGLLKTAIRGDNPVIFCEHKIVYPMKGPVPEEEYTVPFGKADMKRKGEDCTIIATHLMVHKALGAANMLAKEGIDVEVVDPRTLVPLDKTAIIDSVKKTGRVVIVTEDTKTAGTSAEFAAVIAEEAIDYLDAPVKRLAEPDTPIPFSPPLEKFVIPDENAVAKAVREVLGR